MMFKPQLEEKGLDIGLLHVVGSVNTGKSKLRKMLEHVLPKQQTKEGLKVKVEPTLSVFSLRQKIITKRHCLVQDPPITDWENMNKFMDQYFENKIEIKPSMIQPIEEIKALGVFKVKISLHSEVDAEISINVSSAETIQ